MFNGDRVARRDSATVIHYYFSDHLGSSNVVTNKTGLTIEEESDFYPFGGERIISDSLADQNYKFTGKERDSETNLDYFGARYYAFNFGRFVTPDEFTGGPVSAFSPNDPYPSGPLPYADVGNPQSINKYAYAYNNPLKYLDPDGHETWYANEAIKNQVQQAGGESPSYAEAMEEVEGNPNVFVGFVDRGLKKNEENSPGDATIMFVDGGQDRVIIAIDVHRTPDDTVIHEVGHAYDVATNRTEAKKDMQADKKQQGSANRKPHQDRPHEKRANKFRDRVNEEKKKHKEKEKQRKKEEEEMRKRKKDNK